MLTVWSSWVSFCNSSLWGVRDLLECWTVMRCNMHLCVICHWCHRNQKCVSICSCSSPVFTFVFYQQFHFQPRASQTLSDRSVVSMFFFPVLFPQHGNFHPRPHWSDLLEMNGLITGSERGRNTVWHGDEWNWGLGLRKPLRQIEGINDCSTARGPQWPTPSPWHCGCVMASSAALFRY